MKFLKFFFLILFSVVFVAGSSPYLTRLIASQDPYRNGDLYRLSNLSEFREPRKLCSGYTPPARAYSQKKIHLYIIGDSFTEKERVGKNDFPVDAYTYIHWSQVLHFKPDSGEINLLLLEVVERHFREKFVSPISNLMADTATFVTSPGEKSFMHELDDTFSSKLTKERLDEILFQNDLILGLKQMKADFNLTFFDRVNKDVTSVNEGKHLVYYMDTDQDTTKTTSSFATIADSEIDLMVKNLNKTQARALKLGFDRVILSIIPNKVSVLMPSYGHYNRLIDRVCLNQNLGVAYLNIYPDFLKMGEGSYLKGDSHWTCEAQHLWLNKINAMINSTIGSNAL